jgi:hypothetical protein
MTRLSPRQFRHKAFLARWSKVDWSKQNCELVDETGLSKERIRKIREEVGAPKPLHHGRRRKTAQLLQWAKDNLDELKGMTAVELGRKYGLRSQWRNAAPYPFLKPFLRDGRLNRKHPWDRMNLQLPDRDLQRIWRLPRNMAGAYRYRKKGPRPKWRSKPGKGCIRFKRREQLEAYHRAVRAEEQNAERYFAQASGCGGGVNAA